MAGLPKNATEAIAQRLFTENAVTAIVGNRITPNKPLAEGLKPYLCFYRLGGGGGRNLAEVNRLQNGFYRIEFYCDTEEQTEALREVVIDRLCGNPRKGIPPWADRASGVQSCRPVDDADADTQEDGSQIAGQTVSIWFACQIPQT